MPLTPCFDRTRDSPCPYTGQHGGLGYSRTDGVYEPLPEMQSLPFIVGATETGKNDGRVERCPHRCADYFRYFIDHGRNNQRTLVQRIGRNFVGFGQIGNGKGEKIIHRAFFAVNERIIPPGFHGKRPSRASQRWCWAALRFGRIQNYVMSTPVLSVEN